MTATKIYDVSLHRLLEGEELKAGDPQTKLEVGFAGYARVKTTGNYHLRFAGRTDLHNNDKPEFATHIAFGENGMIAKVVKLQPHVWLQQGIETVLSEPELLAA